MKRVDKIRYSKDARNFIKRAHPQTKDAIKKAIEILKMFPPEDSNIKPLKGYKDDRMRYRIGKYRIVFRYEKEELLVLNIIDIGARGDIYK